jgi:glycosyltransferase involved in cell wall biosynthesis
MLTLFEYAVGNMAGVTCISYALKSYLEKRYNPRGKIKVLPNGIPARTFYPMNHKLCRDELGLPSSAKLIGTAGALGSSRGIDVLFRAAENLIAEDASIHLIVAGLLEPGTVLPKITNVHYLGQLEYEQVAILFNALDVGVICNRESSFGRYCFPQKAYEMLACGLLVVAADIGAMSELFINHPESLYEPENQQSLAQAIRKQLVEETTMCSVEIMTWADLAKNMEGILLEIGNQKSDC